MTKVTEIKKDIEESIQDLRYILDDLDGADPEDVDLDDVSSEGLDYLEEIENGVQELQQKIEDLLLENQELRAKVTQQ